MRGHAIHDFTRRVEQARQGVARVVRHMRYWLHPVQVELLTFKRMPLAEDAALPHRQHLQQIGYKAKRVVRRQDRHANGLADDHEQKQVFEIATDPRRLALELIARCAIENLAESSSEGGNTRD